MLLHQKYFCILFPVLKVVMKCKNYYEIGLFGHLVSILFNLKANIKASLYKKLEIPCF